jgi:predicted TIM-barrel fold metal-dependent hydrolase
MSTDSRILSADSHVVEPWYLWRERVPAQHKDRAPRLLREDDWDRLVCEDVFMPPLGLAAGVFRSDSEVRREGRWDEDVPSSAYDPDARLVELDADGITGEVLYPTLGMMLFGIDDLELKWSLFRAYNDWLADFCASHPDRLKGIAIVAPEDIALAVQELKRAQRIGLSGVMMPTIVGEDRPPYHDPVYFPLWQASVEFGMPMHIHSGTSRDKAKAYNITKGRNPLNSIMKCQEVERVFLNLIFAGVFDRFPGLIFVSAENEAGWIAHMLDRADYEWRRYQNVPRLGFDTPCVKPPTTYWQANIRATFMRDLVAVRTHDLCGVETLMFQTDFPHGVSTYPHSRKLVDELFEGVDAEVRHKIVYQNAADLYGF